MKNLERMTITFVKNIEGLEFIDSNGNKTTDIGNITDDGQIIITFANLQEDIKAYEEIENCFKIDTDYSDPDVYLEQVKERLDRISKTISEVLLLDIVNSYIEKPKKFSCLKLMDLLSKKLHSICLFAQSYAMLINRVHNNEYETDQRFLYALALDFFGVHSDINYGVKPAFINNSLVFCDIFSVSSANAALAFDFITVVKENKVIKSCQNCGKYFVPAARSDEIYCNNIFKGNKTCKQVGYEEKINNDDLLKAYRTAYKTKNAFKNRNKKNNLHAQEDFDNWVKSAKEKLEQARSGIINLSDFKKWLKS